MQEQQKTQIVINILQEARRSGRFEKVGLMMANHPAISEMVGDSPDKLDDVRTARRSVFHERKQLNVAFVAPE